MKRTLLALMLVLSCIPVSALMPDQDSQVAGKVVGIYIDLSVPPSQLPGMTVEQHRRGALAYMEMRGDELYVDGKKVVAFSPETSGFFASFDEMTAALGDRTALNANLLDVLMLSPDFIPQSWRRHEYVISFWGTVYRRTSDGKRCVRSLAYEQGRQAWVPGFTCDATDSLGAAWSPSLQDRIAILE